MFKIFKTRMQLTQTLAYSKQRRDIQTSLLIHLINLEKTSCKIQMTINYQFPSSNIKLSVRVNKRVLL